MRKLRFNYFRCYWSSLVFAITCVTYIPRTIGRKTTVTVVDKRNYGQTDRRTDRCTEAHRTIS